MISVITPIYNGERFVEACINVLIAQKCCDLEHVIVDGGSTDGSVEIIKQYAEKYLHIRWISEPDKGQSDAMNKGITMAKGEILGILNVDDFYEPGILNQVLKIFDSLPEPSLLVGNCKVWDDDKIIYLNKPANLTFFELLTGLDHINPFPYNPSAYFYHASLHQEIGFYEIDDHYQMDLDFLLRAVRVANVKYINQFLGNYRLIKGTKTYQSLNNNQSARYFSQLLKRYRKKLNWQQQTQLFLIDRLAIFQHLKGALNEIIRPSKIR